MTTNKHNTKRKADIDRLIVDIAACDNVETLEYYRELMRYIRYIADKRKAELESVGFCVFIADQPSKVFETIEAAHAHCVKKLIAIYDCEEDEIIWQDINPMGYCRSYWVDDRSPSYLHNDVATIHNVDEEGKKIHIFSWVRDALPKLSGDYRSKDEAIGNLSELILENANLKLQNRDLLHRLRDAWDSVNWVRVHFDYNDDTEKSTEISAWLKNNKELLRDENQEVAQS